MTRAGWLFLLVTILVGMGSVRGGAFLLVVFFGFMLGALHVSVVLARRSVGSVLLRRDVPNRVWQNQTVHLAYDLCNRRGRHCLGLHIDELSVEGIESASGYCVHLPPRGAFRAGGRFTAYRRGRIRLGKIRLSTRFPFSLMIATRDFEDPASLVVWPAQGRLKAQLLRRGAVQTSSAAPSPATGGQDEFFGLREYRPDDNPRWIHWRKSAARQTPVVREMARPLPEKLWVIVDTFHKDSSGAAPAEREKLLRFAATVIDHAFARGYQVGVALAHGSGPVVHDVAAGKAQRRRVLDALADVDDNTQCDLPQVLERIPRGSARQAQAIVVTLRSDRLDAPLQVALGGTFRDLTVVSSDALDALFEDDPICAAREAP